jgi:NADH-quinone oxidoreductase subunit C
MTRRRNDVLPEAVAADPLAVALDQQLPDSIAGAQVAADGPVLQIAPAAIVDVCRYLKDVAGFRRIAAVTAVDWWPRTPRFEVIYLLHGLRVNQRLRLTVRVGENEEVDSVTSVWRGANWYEREVYDLFGVPFRSHPHLERIMMPADWEGHPLRKDYPIHGHRYSYRDE